MRTSAAVVLLLACLRFATGPARAEEPKPLTLKEACRRLERAQAGTLELSQRYRAVRIVDGKLEQDLTLEIHRSTGVSVMAIEAGTSPDESSVFLADPYGLRFARGGRVAYAVFGPAEIASVVRPLELARSRLLRRYSVQSPPPWEHAWLFSVGMRRNPDGEVRLSVRIGSTDLTGDDLLEDLSPGETRISTHPDTGLVRFGQDEVTVEIRSRDGLLHRWEMRQPETRTLRVLEAIPGGRTAADWTRLIAETRALGVPDEVQVRLEHVFTSTVGSLPAFAVFWVLQNLAEAVPGFWTDLGRLRKAIDELIPAYLQARPAMDDGIPFVLEPLVFDLKKPFEQLPVEDTPRGAERAAVVALLARSLRELSAAGRRESGEGR